MKSMVLHIFVAVVVLATTGVASIDADRGLSDHAEKKYLRKQKRLRQLQDVYVDSEHTEIATIDNNLSYGSYGRCEGDCDSDMDCRGNLLCFERDAYEAIPGCDGDGEEGTDYCQYPALQTLENNLPAGSYGLCEGDCDADDDCKGSLVCQERDGYTWSDGYAWVLGCTGEGEWNSDYCRYPPLTTLDNDLPAGSYGLCEGDCDSDDGCKGDLVCHHREGFDEIPSCSGDGVENSDYCRPPYLTYIGDELPHDSYGLCEGDCDADEDCKGMLVCQQRDAFEAVDGCEGKGEECLDYCRWP